jgi:tRNA (guanine26-N2/guanine27-N2)-dimethyltransferase
MHDMCKTVHCTPPKAEVFRSALINAGFRVSGSHANPLALKTDAPPEVVWDILRCWIQQHPVKTPEPGSYAAAILGKEVKTQADFKRAAGAVPASVKQGVARFVQNPAFWGPKVRHGKPLKPEQQRQQEVQAQHRRTRQQQQQQEGQEQAATAASAAAAAAGGGQQQQQKQQQEQQQQQQQEQQQPVKLDENWEEELDDLYGEVEAPSSRAPKRQRQLAGAGKR